MTQRCTDPEATRPHALGADMASCHTCAMTQEPPDVFTYPPGGSDDAAAREAAAAGRFTADPRAVYLTDNGAAYCGAHLGSTAKHSGRDLSGQPIEPVTPLMARVARKLYGRIPACETCGLVAERSEGV